MNIMAVEAVSVEPVSTAESTAEFPDLLPNFLNRENNRESAILAHLFMSIVAHLPNEIGHFAPKFPTHYNRELFSKNRDFPGAIREFCGDAAMTIRRSTESDISAF